MLNNKWLSNCQISIVLKYSDYKLHWKTGYTSGVMKNDLIMRQSLKLPQAIVHSKNSLLLPVHITRSLVVPAEKLKQTSKTNNTQNQKHARIGTELLITNSLWCFERVKYPRCKLRVLKLRVLKLRVLKLRVFYLCFKPLLHLTTYGPFQ